jgi:hypothetical protein
VVSLQRRRSKGETEERRNAGEEGDEEDRGVEVILGTFGLAMRSCTSGSYS